MSFWEGFLIITGVHLLAAASPGPDFVLISQHTLRYGKIAGLWCALGISLGLGIHIVYSVLGLAVVIAQSTTLLWVIKVLGAGYLLYLGFQGIKAKAGKVQSLDVGYSDLTLSSRKSLAMGFACNVLNPKAPIYFIALFTSVLEPNLPTAWLSIYGVLMIVLQFIWFAGIVFLLSIPKINYKFQSMSFWLDRIFGVALILLAIKILLF